jgi:HEPN domain-containing protein
MPGPAPLWGSFLHHADEDLLSFAWLFSGGLRVHGYYHAVQAIEKYLKALALSVADPHGKTLTALNTRWVINHDLKGLARRCAKQFPYYGSADTLNKLAFFMEFDQATRYPWVQRTLGNGFKSTDIPLIWDLIRHLRTDIPIKVDDYLLGMVVRGHHQGQPNVVNEGINSNFEQSKMALVRMFPDVATIVRW